MSKESDKKTLIILLIILGLACIFSAVWLYNSFKAVHFVDKTEYSDLDLIRVTNLKKIAVDNIEDFLKSRNLDSKSIWKNFYQDEQYRELEELKIEINTWDNIGNPYPFAPIIIEEEEEEDEEEFGPEY